MHSLMPINMMNMKTGTEKSVCSASSRGFMSRRTMKALYLKIYGWVFMKKQYRHRKYVCRYMYICRDITMIRKILKSTVRALWQTCLGGSIQGKGLALATLHISEQSSVICIRNLYRTVMRESWLWLQRTTF